MTRNRLKRLVLAAIACAAITFFKASAAQPQNGAADSHPQDGAGVFHPPNETDPTNAWEQLEEELRQFEQEQVDWLIEESAVALEDQLTALDWTPGFRDLWSLSVQLSPLFGWTDNVLRADDRTGSGYGGTEAEIFLIGQPVSNAVFTAFAFADWRRFTARLEEDSETIALGQMRWQQGLNHARWSLVATADHFYGDQILDSLDQPAPGIIATQRIRQSQTGGSIGAIWRPGARTHELHATLSGADSRFSNGNDDHRRMVALVSWQAQWTETLRSSLEVNWSREPYRHRPARTASGTTIPDSRLNLQYFRISPRFEWRTPFLNDLRAHAGFLYQWARDDRGDFDDQQRGRAYAGLVWRTGPWRISTGVDRWQIRYRERHTAFSDPSPLRQNRVGAHFAIRRQIIAWMEAELRYDIVRFNSSRTAERYGRQAVEGVIHLSF